MKQYTTPVLEVTFDIPHETVSTISFLFKQEREQEADTILLKRYPGGVGYADGVYRIPFTAEETGLFARDEYFYMDTRITDQTGNVPSTPIVPLYMSQTLFKWEEVSE